jgi:oligopeptide transport system substrate-binding protein
VAVHGEAWADAENLVTNGPFRLASWQENQALLLVTNPEYHGRFAGNVQRVQVTFESGPVLLAMYDSDGLDVLDLYQGLPHSELERARHQHAGEFVSAPQLLTWYVGFDASRPPFDDPRVRQAFALATDKETLGEATVLGSDRPATGGFVPPGMPGHSPGIGLPYDPRQAGRLLEEAGYPAGRGFPVMDLRGPPLSGIWARHWVEQWRENLGIELTLDNTLEWSAYIDRLREAPPHIFMMAWSADYPDPDNFLRVGALQFVRWRDERYEHLVGEARRVTDQEERMRLLRRADEILTEQAAILPVVYPGSRWLVKPWVARFTVAPNGHMFLKDVIIEPH